MDVQQFLDELWRAPVELHGGDSSCCHSFLISHNIFLTAEGQSRTPTWVGTARLLVKWHEDVKENEREMLLFGEEAK